MDISYQYDPWHFIHFGYYGNQQEGKQTMTPGNSEKIATTAATAAATAIASINTTPAKSELEKTREYLSGRSRNVFHDHVNKLADQFNLYADNTPKTYKELIDAIKNDKFKLDEKKTQKVDDQDEKHRYYGNDYGIIWDGPQPDRVGFEAASKELHAAGDKTRDAIMALPSELGLKALEEFQAWTPTAKTDTVH